MRRFVCIAGLLMILNYCSFGQNGQTVTTVTDFPNKFFARINAKASGLDEALTKQTEKYLRKLAKQEQKIHDRVYKLDSNAANNLFAGTQAKYASLESSPKNTTPNNDVPLTGEYVPYADSIKSSLAFAQKNPQLLNASSKQQQEINAALAQFNQLQGKFQNADQVKEYIKQRKEAMKQQLQQYIQNPAIKKYLDQYSQTVYYYSAQVREYKEALSDPDKMLQKALTVLNKIPAFTKFAQQNGQLAGLFGVAGNYGTPDAIIGLQSKDQVQQLLQSTVSAGGSGGAAALQSNLETAHDQLDQYKDKLSALGGGSADIDMPNFQPNNQRTKTFLKKIDVGVNLQTTMANVYFPNSTSFGISIGYKASSKFTYGVGVAYIEGWGTSINHIRLSSQGASIRSFIDMRIKENIYLSGGLEANYTTPFTSFAQLKTESMWQKSGLIGFSKLVSLPGKLVKRTKISLLWDFLSYYQIPRTQPILFRIGYGL